MATMTCYVYMILCKNGALYTGVTNDIIRRWREHFTGRGARYIAKYGFVKPVFLQEFPDKSAAMKEERYIKKMGRAYKDELVSSELNILLKDPDYVHAEWINQGYKGLLPWE